MTQSVDMDYAALASDTAIKVEAAKHDLRSWMASTTHNPSILHMALLEEALPGIIAEHGAKDARSLVLAAVTLFTPDDQFTDEQRRTIQTAQTVANDPAANHQNQDIEPNLRIVDTEGNA